MNLLCPSASGNFHLSFGIMINRIIRFFLENKLVTFLFFLLILGWGLATAPFNWDLGSFPVTRCL